MTLALLLACTSAGPLDTATPAEPFTPEPRSQEWIGTHPLRRLNGDRFTVRLDDSDPEYRCDRGESRPELCERDYRALSASLYSGSEDELARCVEDTTEALLDLRAEVEAGTAERRDEADNDTLAAEVSALVEALALADAVVGIEAGPVHDEGDHGRVELILDHPVLGEIPGRLLLPPFGWQQAPTLLMLPGHLPEADSQLDDLARLRHGQRLAAEGFIVLSLAFRAYDAGTHEALVTTELLCAGASLMGVRQVEAELGLGLLDALRPDERPAVMGHSGGAISATLLGTWAPIERVALDAVADRFLNVYRSDDGGSVQVLDETVPALVPWWDCLYQLGLDYGLPAMECAREAAAVPHLYQAYGYAEEDWPALLAFLREG